MTDLSRGAMQTQVDGSHYKNMAIQPIEFCEINNLNACQAKIVKYVSRHKSKNGAADIRKGIHCLDLLLELSVRWRRTEFSPLLAPSVEIRRVSGLPFISGEEYCVSNSLGPEESSVILIVSETPDESRLLRARSLLERLLRREYGVSI